jgi:prepilin-type N-terminal cleavage/methylation domain-containing protein
MNKKGLTLIELLVSLVLFSIIAVTLGASFRQGLLSWRRGRQAADITQEAASLLEGMSRELRNAVTVPGVSVAGEESSLIFYVVPPSMSAADPRMMKVCYRSTDAGSSSTDAVVEKAMVSCASPHGDASPLFQRLTRGSSRVRFAFAYADPHGGPEPLWKPIWRKKDVFPSAVRVRLDIFSAGEPEIFVKTIPLPLGVFVPWDDHES